MSEHQQMMRRALELLGYWVRPSGKMFALMCGKTVCSRQRTEAMAWNHAPIPEALVLPLISAMATQEQYGVEVIKNEFGYLAGLTDWREDTGEEGFDGGDGHWACGTFGKYYAQNSARDAIIALFIVACEDDLIDPSKVVL